MISRLPSKPCIAKNADRIPSTVADDTQVIFVSGEKEAGNMGNSGDDKDIAMALAIILEEH